MSRPASAAPAVPAVPAPEDAAEQPVTAWMIADPAVVDEAMLASAVACHIDQIGRRHVFAVDAEGRLAGLINRGQLLRHLVARRLSGGVVPDVPIAELLVRALVTVFPDVTAREAICTMRRYHVGCLPVVDADGHLVGLLSERCLAPVLDAVVDANRRPAPSSVSPAPASHG